MKTIVLHILPKPKPQTKNQPKAYRKYKRDVAFLAKAKGLTHLPEQLHVTFFFAPPKSDPNRSGYHKQKPDLDNLIKGLLDALAGIKGDDAHVCSLMASKEWGDKNQILITWKDE